MKIENKIYHATLKENADSIWMYGIKPGKDGMIYLADSINGAASFLMFRGAELEDILVLEIDPEALDERKLGYGTDHNPNFFEGVEVYVYVGEIIDPVCIDEAYTLYRLEDEQ